MSNVMEIEIMLIDAGFFKEVDGVIFEFKGDRIEVWVDLSKVDEIDCIDSDGLPRVNTEYDFDMEAMFWLQEYNRI
jgi:hypothetical protein